MFFVSGMLCGRVIFVSLSISTLCGIACVIHSKLSEKINTNATPYLGIRVIGSKFRKTVSMFLLGFTAIFPHPLRQVVGVTVFIQFKVML